MKGYQNKLYRTPGTIFPESRNNKIRNREIEKQRNKNVQKYKNTEIEK